MSAEPGQSKCLVISQDVTDRPIGSSVGAGGTNARADTLMVQQLLNSVPREEGGPDLLLAEDGLIGPKTQAAINKFQKKVLSKPDGRIDPGGPTIKALSGVICDSPAVPLGRLGLVAQPNQVGGGPPMPPSATKATRLKVLSNGNQVLIALRPRLALLGFKLTHQAPSTVAFCNKHFATGNSKVTSTEIGFINGLVSAIHFHAARPSATGILPIRNVIEFDPRGDISGYTVHGGDKLSTKESQIYVDEKGKPYKLPGQTIFLTSKFARKTGFDIHLVVLHEMAHFVGPRAGTGIEIEDHDGTYATSPKLLQLTKFQKLHNAEIICLFMLEACVGTANLVTLPDLALHRAHYNSFPRVSATGDIVTS
jgi:peptidoglycan hydrolase-like protein with peptidoglycan-binding domain